MSSEQQPATKGAKLKNALKSAARIPRIPNIKAGKGSGRNEYAPKQGELPVVIFRIQVLGCMSLLAKDRGGTSDPFVVVTILNQRKQTPVSKKTLNPVYTAKDATFDFPIYLSLADRLGVVEFVVWDKDMLGKDYLGEVSLPLEDWFTSRANKKETIYGFDQPENDTISLNLSSTRANTTSTGSIQIKIGFAPTPNSNNLMDFDEIYSELVKRSRPSLVSAPPTEGVGTVRSSQGGRNDYEDDGGLSSDSEDEDEDEEFVDASDTSLPTTVTTPQLSDLQIPQTSTPDSYPSSGQLKPPELTVEPTTPETPTADQPTPLPGPETTPKPGQSFVAPTPTSTGGKFNPKNFVRKLSGLTSSSSASHPDSVGAPATKRSASRERKVFGRSKSSGTSTTLGESSTPVTPTSPMALGAGKRTKSDYEFKGGNDILGIVMLEVQGADDLPRLANMMRTGWDMDPFVVISFGKKVFRTRVIRHSRNPTWDEKMLFHVRRYEKAFKIQFTILDWDKLSSNDLIGEAHLDMKQLLDNVPTPDPTTGLYPPSDEDGEEKHMQDFSLKLSTQKTMPWESNHEPTIRFKAKYQPYDALRQRFWRQYLRQYDTDDTGAMSHIELTSMLDSLGSTLTHSTINSFFSRFGKNPREDEITIEQAVQCLETELGRPDSEKKRINVADSQETSVSATPILMTSGQHGEEIQLDNLDFSGPSHVDTKGSNTTDQLKPVPPPPYPTEGMQQPLADVAASDDALYSSSSEAEIDSASTTLLEPAVAAKAKSRKPRFAVRGRKKNSVVKPSKEGSDSSGNASDDSFERVINVKNCPLCHRPRMNDKAEVDIITHLAVCASQDWNKVDRIMVGNFVTASQAQRKWYTKIVGKISSGNYKLGANSANIIVQNRMTGQLEEEKMQVYVRLGIRLLYKGASSRMEGARARGLLKSLSIKQGLKYDDPESAKDIPAFIVFHNLDRSEILDPLESFKTFNQFFYRKLKADARPVEEPDNSNRIVSGADCRLMAFETVSEATRLWIKGREFTVARLLGEAYKTEAEKYNGGALCIFRLAPQDYHRFHSPVDGVIGPMTYIAGEYYTVNPQAIRTALDVYGENARKIVPIDTPQFGRVFAVCIGAMMVGSIQTTLNEGDAVKRGQEFGYFAFGGSTIVVIFEKGKVEWDEDLLINGQASLETLVRVGMGIGRRRTN
ncbi:phosphatidylserine decarboxylase-domain-containing protein [Crepidotus variabilis]|uniref:Phosphatidylserine decarboxylase proenzyme 2 n=1 Tax=Crepidotus variabilis TaxID=179855 RepID=A0A9P6ESX4_9AGAR|nr:phosphatidylserine decarboxylase-domain-containing protein [Crepidotus variabilis]